MLQCIGEKGGKSPFWRETELALGSKLFPHVCFLKFPHEFETNGGGSRTWQWESVLRFAA